MFYLTDEQIGILRLAPYNSGIGKSWTEGDVQIFLETVEKAIAADLKRHEESMETFAAAKVEV